MVTKEQKKPLVSIITPSFNQGQFLEQTICSVLSQEYPNVEYIVIDGESTDNSIEVIKKYAAQISFWTSRPDNGQAEAINEGFQRSTGKYVAWLNSDDVYLAGCVQKAVDVMEANPEVAMVFGQVEVIDERGKRIAEFRPITYRFEDLLTYRIIIPQQAAFFRRSVLENIGELDTNLHFALDHDFFLRIGMNYPVVSIPEVMAQYRISKFNKGSISRSKWAEEFVQILDNIYLQPEAKHKFGQYERSAYAGAYYNGACSLLDESLYVQARRWYLISAKYSQNILFGVRWWIGFIRTFLGKGGNILYVNLKIWLAKKNLIDFQYDWWVALALSETNKD